MAPTQDVVGFAPLIPTSPQQVVWIEQGDVLHHCSYRRVNGWLPLLTNNPLSWHDATRLERIALPVGSTTHRFRVRVTPRGRSPARPQRGRYPIFPLVRPCVAPPPARVPTLRMIGCGTEGDNPINSGTFLWGQLWTTPGYPQQPLQVARSRRHEARTDTTASRTDRTDHGS